MGHKEKISEIAEIVKYEGDNSTFVWKHPCEDFDSNTQLFVHESQEAIFFLNGQALDLFGAGRYTLETKNTPRLGEMLSRLVGEDKPFHAEVYFVNKTEQMNIKWGTDSRISFIEPTYNFPLSVGASGEMSLRVEDSRNLLVKLVGTDKDLSQARLTGFFRAVLMTKVKSYIAQTIKNDKINIFEIDERLQEFSEMLHSKLISDFAAYGVVLERFYITNVAKPDGEAQYEKFKSLYFRQYSEVAEAKLRQQVSIIDEQTKAQKTVIESQALATKRAQEGYTYQQERSFEVADKIAGNETAGQFANLGIGLGTLTGVGNTVSNIVEGSMKGIGEPATHKCKCGAILAEGAKFCPECGEKCLDNNQIICPSCGKAVAKAKFCAECGHKFLTDCPSCGAQVGENVKFCPECGQKLA